ncbi:MAG: 2'-5' RNA ligase family protein [Actinomycetota bacterium]|nr:2'-5' RNA ligase family protein [Actinomycetota bacterium]
MTAGEVQTALLVPIPEAEPLVGPWRARYALDARKGVPAHVTVMAPFLRPEEIGPDVVGNLNETLGRFEPWDFRLVRPARFDDALLYLEPDRADPFLELTRVVMDLFPGLKPYGGQLELDEVIPHLTVADCQAPGICEDGAVLDRVEREIAGSLPVDATASQVWLMSGDGTWKVDARFALHGDLTL